MAIQNLQWAPIFGSCSVVHGVLKYEPQVVSEGPSTGEMKIVVMKSDQFFENGTITFRVTINDPEAKVQIGLSHGYPIEVYCGLNNGNAAYGISTFSNGKWENFTTAGYGATPPLGTPIIVRLVISGSSIEMFANGVKVVQGTYSVRKSQVAVLIGGRKPIEVELVSIEAQPSVAFVVMQFTDEFNALYQEVISPVCKSFGLKAVRADDIYNNGLIIEDIARSIREATVVIADITPNNPNVYYEVGYAHGIAKPTILLSERKRDALPFDVNGFRTIFYDNTIGGKGTVEAKLKHHLESIQPR